MFFKIVSSSSQKQKKKEKIDFFKATQTNASAQREEKDARASCSFTTTTFANSTGERASHRRRERGLNRAKTRSTHAVWRRRERFRGRKIITSVFSAFRRDDDINQCAIESTYNNRNRKRLKKWRRNESRKSLWCVVLLLFSRGENVVRFFSGVGVVADGSRRVARARSRISRRL